jgi:hypothetical protein
VLLDSHELGQLHTGIAIHAQCYLLGTQRVELEAVHEYDANTSERIVVELADRLSDHVFPAHALLSERCACISQ